MEFIDGEIEVKENERVVILKRPAGYGFSVGGDVKIYTKVGNAATTLFIVAPQEVEIRRLEALKK